MEVVRLAASLAAIPSYVNDETNERALGRFVLRWAREQLPGYGIRTFTTAPGRINFLIQPRRPMEVLFCAHLDTVLPSPRWCAPKVVKGKLFGTGAVDMKGAMAAMLLALKNAGQDSRAGLLLYVDEEYSFAGMQTIVRQLTGIKKPALLVTGEPTDRRVALGCRGMGIMHLVIRGKTAHSARPIHGRSVSDAFRLVHDELARLAARATHRALGRTLVNIYHAEFGLAQRKAGKSAIVVSSNRLPDILSLDADIRIAAERLRLGAWRQPIRRTLQRYGYRLASFKVEQEMKSLYTSPQRLQPFLRLVRATIGRVSFSELSEIGYYDMEMLAHRWRIPAVSIGAGPKAVAHTAAEYVRCSDLKKLEKLYTRLASLATDI